MKSTLINNILFLEFDTRFDICSTMMRFQEFYECPNPDIRRKVFSHEKIIDDYARRNNGIFSYYEDWSGFNVPGECLSEFFTRYNEIGESLWKKEERVLSEIEKAGLFNRNTYTEKEPFYLIASMESDKSTMRHEFSHALWYLDKDYKNTMQSHIKKMPRAAFKRGTISLKNMGYDKSVFKDEIQAYMSTSTKAYLVNEMGIDVDIDENIKEFRKTFKCYYSKIS